MRFNRLHNCKNPYQGNFKKVLCVCSAGLLRSPTAAVVLSQEPFNFNTRACGVSQGHALIPLDEVLLEWADEIVCFEQEHVEVLAEKTAKEIVCLDIPDMYEYRNPELVEMIRTRYQECLVK